MWQTFQLQVMAQRWEVVLWRIQRPVNIHTLLVHISLWISAPRNCALGWCPYYDDEKLKRFYYLLLHLLLLLEILGLYLDILTYLYLVTSIRAIMCLVGSVQGCALAAPGRLRRLTLGFGRPKTKTGRPTRHPAVFCAVQHCRKAGD